MNKHDSAGAKQQSPKKEKHKATRRQKYLMLSGATTFLIVVALVLINVLTIYITDRYPVTIDLTPEKVFQLTDQSKEYIAQLSKPVTVQVMTSEENFIAGGEYYVQANAVLKEYEKYSDQITLGNMSTCWKIRRWPTSMRTCRSGTSWSPAGHGPRRWTPTTCLMLRAAPITAATSPPPRQSRR